MSWLKFDDCYIYPSDDFNETTGYVENFGYADRFSLKFALFDLNETLITPKNGYEPFKFYEEANPKMYVYLGEDKIFDLFQKLKDNNYIIGIITNQYHFNNNVKRRMKALQRDFENRLGWNPIWIANIKDPLLKPNSRSFEVLCASLGIKIDDIRNKVSDRVSDRVSGSTFIEGFGYIPNLFYCGDSAGNSHPYLPYRLSDMDILFAQSISELLGIKNICKFLTPDQIFGHYIPEIRNYQELVVMVGMPGSGKSTISKYFLENGNYVNAETDLMPNWDRKLTIDLTDLSLKDGFSVIANANNPSRENRNDFIRLAKKYKVPIRILWFVRNGRPFNQVRGKILPKLPTTFIQKKPVPQSAFTRYVENFEEPRLNETIIKVNGKDKVGELEIVY